MHVNEISINKYSSDIRHKKCTFVIKIIAYTEVLTKCETRSNFFTSWKYVGNVHCKIIQNKVGIT